MPEFNFFPFFACYMPPCCNARNDPPPHAFLDDGDSEGEGGNHEDDNSLTHTSYSSEDLMNVVNNAVIQNDFQISVYYFTE